jgi:NAD(P)-dependent dehydrogenase (short-subunit alcohol dehydrogenase family)
MKDLNGKVALVTGASRGIGKGIARVLGQEGMTVYVTGRSVNPGDHPFPGTVGETAEEVTQGGGRGIALAVDHADEDQIAALFERIRKDEGRLDILVNNAAALPDDLIEPNPFWEKPLSNWEIIDVGVRSHFFAAWHAAKLMVPNGSGLIVAISGYVGAAYGYGVLFGMGKTAADRMARDMAIELKPYNIASISLWQGLTYTEKALANLASQAAKMGTHFGNKANGCTPDYQGMVIAALAKDPDIMKRSGGTFISAEVGQDYGIVDIDGSQPRSLRDELAAPIWGPV